MKGGMAASRQTWCWRSREFYILIHRQQKETKTVLDYIFVNGPCWSSRSLFLIPDWEDS